MYMQSDSLHDRNTRGDATQCAKCAHCRHFIASCCYGICYAEIIPLWYIIIGVHVSSIGGVHRSGSKIIYDFRSPQVPDFKQVTNRRFRLVILTQHEIQNIPLQFNRHRIDFGPVGSNLSHSFVIYLSQVPGSQIQIQLFIGWLSHAYGFKILLVMSTKI